MIREIITTLPALTMILFSPLTVHANADETIAGFTKKQTEVVKAAFTIVEEQNWESLTDENLTTLSQAAAIALNKKNIHYDPPAAFLILQKLLDVQYKHKPLNKLTQDAFKQVMLLIMKGEHHAEIGIRRIPEFLGDLRQMREMLKDAQWVEKRKTDECLLKNVHPLLAKLSAIPAAATKAAQESECVKLADMSCIHTVTDSQDYRTKCKRINDDGAVSYQNTDNRKCENNKQAYEACVSAKKSIIEVLTSSISPAAVDCQNKIQIAEALHASHPFITIEEIERTIKLEDTLLAYNMGLSVTDAATGKTFHLIRDARDVVETETAIEDEDNFDLDPKTLALPAASECSNAQSVQFFINKMKEPRAKTVQEAINKAQGRATPMIAAPEGATAPQIETPTENLSPQPEQGYVRTIWSRLAGLFS